MMAKIFIDGSAGTTGLKIYERLSTRKDLELLILDDNLRKNDDARREMLNKADVAFLCLPDEAAIEAVKMVENPNTVIIDTSTAHRVADGWTYGFPELSGMRKKIATSKRIANPGCHASGFVALIKPLVEKGFLDKDTNLSCFSLTGYSGGGKKMIAEYEDENRDILLDAPRLYALTQNHKHLKEMK
ncbi:MAG: N-acetyl-gamma-glutamyl-phosphate reductase, partial [Clostridia bacterium]|nr:N-acetyl-gamma-glutamyl-phosphate reductase [Clostridia bacterium]